MAAGVHIQEPVLDTLRREDENDMDQAINITPSKILLEGNIGDGYTPIERPDTLETDFEVKDSVEGNQGSASTVEGEKFLISPSAAEVHFEEHNLAPDAFQVNENAEKMATEHETDALHVGEAKLDAKESNGSEKELVTELEVPTTREVGHDEPIPVHEVGLSENKEDSENTISEKEAAHMESLKVNPEDTITCFNVNDTETKSSVEEKSMTSSTSQDIPSEKNEQSTFDTNKETTEMKTDENLEKEDEKPESTLIPEGKIKNEESMQNELFETKNETETAIQKSEEVIENGLESSPVAASEAEDIEASTSDHDTKASALENLVLTENPQEIEVNKSECNPEKETPEEQVITETATRDVSHDETRPVDKAKTEDEEPNKSDFIETKEDTETTILEEKPILEKHLEPWNAIQDDFKECDLVQDTETKGSIKEKLPTATPQEIWGDKIEQTSFDTKEESPEGISTNVSNEETEQNSIVEVPFVTEALTTDNETKGKIKDEDQRGKYLLENNNVKDLSLKEDDTIPKFVESPQLDAEVIKTHVLDQDAETTGQISASEGKSNDGESAVKYEVKTEVGDQKEDQSYDNEKNPESNVLLEAAQIETPVESLQETLPSTVPQGFQDDKAEEQTVDAIQKDKEILDNTSTIVPDEEKEQNLIIEMDDSHMKTDKNLEKEDEKPESTLIPEEKIKNEESKKNELSETKNETETVISQKNEEDIENGVESLPVAASEAEDIEASTPDHDTKKNALENQILTENPHEIEVDKSACKPEKKTPELQNISTIVSNEETKQNLSIELDDSQMKIDENLEKEDEKPESTLIPEGEIKNEESAQNELYETKNTTKTMIQKSEEVIESGVESSPVAASEVEDIEASTSDHDTKTSALKNQILTENPQEIEVDKSECKPEKETPKEQMITETTTRDASHDETMPADKAETEDEEPNKSDFIETKEDTESTILVEEPVSEKHLESFNAIHDDKSSIKEKLPTAISREIWGDEIVQTSFDTKEETPEDISPNVSNEETEQNSIVEVPFVTEALTTDNETEGKIKDGDQRGKDLLENNDDTESELLKQEVTEKPVKSLQLANEAEDTKDGESGVKYEVKTEDDDQKEDQSSDNEKNPESNVLLEAAQIEMPIESLQETLPSTILQGFQDDKEEEKTVDAIQKDKEILENTSTIVPNEEIEQNLSIELDDLHLKTDENLEKEDEKPESTLTPEEKIKNEESTQNKNETETVIHQKNEEVIENGIESSPVATSEAEDIETSTSDHDKETSALKNQIPTENPLEIEVDQSECKPEKETSEEQVSTSASMTSEDASLTKREAHLEKESEKPCFTNASMSDASHGETTPVDKAQKDEEPSKSDLFENKKDTRSTILVEEPILEKHLESLNAIHDDIEECDLVQDTETKSSIKEKLPTATPQEIWGEKIEQTSFHTKEETPEDISTNVSNKETEQNSIVEVPFVTKALITDNELAITKGKIKDEVHRGKYLLENNNDTESELLKQEATEKPVESLQLANEIEDTKVSTSDHDSTISVLENQTLTENPQEIVADETESKPVDVVNTKKETLDGQDVSTIESNDDNQENLVIVEDESKKPLLTEESTSDAAGDESTYTHRDKHESEDQRRAELFEHANSAESLSLIKDDTIPKLVESPQVEPEDIKTHVLDQDAETTSLISESEEKSNDGESMVKTEDNDQKEDQLCDDEKNPESNVLLQAAQIETPIESLQETLPSTIPRGFQDDETEEKTVDAIHTDKEILDVQNVTKTVSNEKIEENSLNQMDGSSIQPEESLEKEHEIPSLIEAIDHDSLLPVAGSQIQCKEYSEEESERSSNIEVSTKNIHDDNPLNVHEDSSEHEDLRKDDFGGTEITSKEEEAQVETPANLSNIAAEDVIASDLYRETETTSSQEERTLNEEETVCKQIEVETLDTADTKTQTLEAQDVSTIVSNDDSGENSATEENDLRMKNEETFGKETEKSFVTETSTTDAANDDSANNCEDKVEDKEQTRAELFEDEKDMESKLLKEEEKMVRLFESPRADNEDIKMYVSNEGAEITGMVEASERDADNDESAVKNEVKTEDNNKKEDKLSAKEKHTESDELLEAAQTEKPIESLQETLPSTVPRGFLDDNTEKKIVDALQKDEDVQNDTTTVPNEKIENSLIQMDGSQIQHEEYLEKKHEIPSVIEALIKHANDYELIAHEDNIEHEDPRKVERESEKDTEINLKEDDAQIETHIKSSQVAAEDVIASDSYQGTETTDSQEDQTLNENEIVHEETEVERLDAADTKKEIPEAPVRTDLSTFVLNDDNEENLVIGEDDSEMKNEDNLGKESENPSSIEASPMDTSSDESTKKFEDKIEDKEQTRAEDTEFTLLKEAETAVQPLESPQVDAEDIKIYVSDQGTETTCPVEVFEEVADDSQPEVKCMIKTEDKVQKEDELCDNEKIAESTLHLEVAEMDKPFESLKEALPTSVSRGFLDEKTEEKIIDTTEKDEETHVMQNVTTIVSNENIEDDSLHQVDGSQMQSKECSEEESERTPIIESSTKNVNDDDSINVHEDSTEHEDLRKDELVDAKKDTKITSQKEEEQVETAVKSLNIAAEDISILNEEEIVVEQIEVETLDTADTMTKTPEAQDVSTTIPDDDIEAKSVTGKNDSEMIFKENMGKESEKPFVIEAWTMNASGDESTNEREDKVEGEEQTGAEMFVDPKDSESTLLKEEETKVKLVESPHEDTENIKTFVSYEGANTTGMGEAFEGDADDDKSTIKYEVQTEDNDQKDNEKNPESGVLLETAQIEKPIESLQETLTSTVPRDFQDDKTEEKKMDAIEEDKEILDIQSVTKTVPNEKIEDNSLIQADGSQIQHEGYLEKEIKIPSVIEDSTKHADDDELISIHEDNIEHKDRRKIELLESNRGTEINLQKEVAQMETSVKSLQVAAEDIIASDSYHGTETTSQEEPFLNENEMIHEQTEVERLDIADSDKEIPEAQDFTTVDASQIKREELLERDSETPPLPLLHSSDGKSAIVDMGKIEDEVLEKADKFEGIESREATSLNEEAPAEKLTESSKDLEGIKESITCDGTEITSSIEEQNLTTISQEIVDDQEEEKVLNVVGEASDFTTIIPDNNNTERNLLIEVDASQMKHEEHLEEEREMPSLLVLNTSTEEPTIVQENKIMENREIILSNEKALENSSKENENIKAYVLCEDTETSSIEQESLMANSHEIVGDQVIEKIIDMAQNAPDLTTITSDENSEENSLIQLDGSQIKHEEPLERENETPSTSMLDTTIEESTILQGHITDDQDPRKVDEFELEKDMEATLLKEPKLAEKVTESVKDDLEDTKVFLSCEEITISIEEQSPKDNQQEIVVDQTQENILDSATKAQDFKQTVLHENAGENLLIQVDESEVKHEIVSDQTQKSVVDTAPVDQDSKSANSHENGEENSLIQVDEIQMKHDELGTESEPPSLLIVDTSNEESKTTYEDITEDENRKKIHDLECEKQEEITSTEQETQVTKVNESSKEDLDDIKALVLDEDSETTSFEEKQSFKENPREISSDQQEEKILDIAPEAQNFIEVGLNEKVEKDSMIQEDGAPVVHDNFSEKEEEGEMPSLSTALIPNTTNEDSTAIHDNKIENEDTRELDIYECERHGKIFDAAPEATESNIIVLDENTEEKSSNQVDKSQTKHEELLEKKSKTLSLSETSLLNTSNEDSTSINVDKIEDDDPENVDELECEITEFPLTKEEQPGQIPNNPLKEDIDEIKEFVSCLDAETRIYTEDRSLQINPKEVTGDQMVENIIDTTPETQNFTKLVSDENTKESLSQEDDESQIKQEELLENESVKPSLSILKTSNEEPSFICHSKTENKDVKKHEKVEHLKDFPEEGREVIEVPVPSENLETTSPVEEQGLTENPQENLTKDKILEVVPEALESKSIVSDKNIEENLCILEAGSQMKREEHSEKESEKPSVLENSILNTSTEEPTLFLDDKIEEEDQAKGEQSLTVNPIENVGGQEVEKVLDKALEARDFTPVVPDDNNDDNPSIQVDGSQMKHEEPLEKESEMLSSLETSLLNTNNEETENIHKDLIEDEALEGVDEFETKKCSEEAQVEESTVYKDNKAYVSYQDTEASALQEQILAAKPQDNLGNQPEYNVIDTADAKEKITEKNLPVSLIQIDESETKHEEILEKEPYLEKTSTVEANNESTISHENMIEEESGKIIESTLLNEGSPAYESVESLQVVSEDIKASVSSQKIETKSSNLNADPQEITENQTDDKINTAGTREITLEELNMTMLDSNENKALDSITSDDVLKVEDEEMSMLADNEESIIVHEDTIESEDLKKVDTFESVQQTEDTLLKEEALQDESLDSLHVASEPIKASVSCQDRDPTSSFEEQIRTRTPQIMGDRVEEKLTDTAKTWEKTPEVSSSVLAFQEDDANRIGVDDKNSEMIKDEETVSRSNAAENDEICSSDKVQAKEEEMEIISKTKIDEEAEKDDTWIKLTDDEITKTSVEEKEIDFSSHDKDTFEITRHDGAKDIPKGNENSRDKNEFLEDGHSNGRMESTIPIVNEEAEKLDKDIKAEAVITETGAASNALPITGVQCGPEETESEDSKAKETETSLAPEGREYQSQHTKLHESPSPPLSHVKESEWEMAQERGRDNLQSGDDTEELAEGSVAISNEGNFLEANLNECIETEVTAGEKEASPIQEDLVSELVVQEIQEQPRKTVEAAPEEKGIKSEEGEIKFDDSDDLTIRSSIMVTDKVAPSDILCSSPSDAGQRAVVQGTPIDVQEIEQKPGEGKAVEAVPEEKGINTEGNEIKEHDFNVLKENSHTVALDKVTPVNILQGSATDVALRATDEETPEQHGLDEASLKEIERSLASTTDKLRAYQIDNANFDSSLGSNKIPVLQHGDSSESSQTEGEKQKTSEPEKGDKCGSEETAKLMKMSESTVMDKPSLSGLLQEPIKEVLKVVDHSTDRKESTTKEEELQAEKSAELENDVAKTDKEKDGGEESSEHQISDLSSDAPVMVDAANKDVKVAYKKSHNILYGVGSKVRHSISKVKKAITGKSSHPKSASPKYSDKI